MCVCVCVCVCVSVCDVSHVISTCSSSTSFNLLLSDLWGSCSLVDGACHLPIRRSVVWSPAPPVYLSKCPCARYWTPNCSRWLWYWCVCKFLMSGLTLYREAILLLGWECKWEWVNGDLCCKSALSSWKTRKDLYKYSVRLVAQRGGSKCKSHNTNTNSEHQYKSQYTNTKITAWIQIHKTKTKIITQILLLLLTSVVLWLLYSCSNICICVLTFTFQLWFLHLCRDFCFQQLRKSCSGVKWAVSAKLKPTDGVAHGSACHVARCQF